MGNITPANGITILFTGLLGFLAANPQLIPPQYQPYVMAAIAVLASVYHLNQPAPPPVSKP